MLNSSESDSESSEYSSTSDDSTSSSESSDSSDEESGMYNMIRRFIDVLHTIKIPQDLCKHKYQSGQ